jgi:hypothetical protein
LYVVFTPVTNVGINTCANTIATTAIDTTPPIIDPAILFYMATYTAIPKTANNTNMNPTTEIICDVDHRLVALLCQVDVLVVTIVGIKTCANTIATTAIDPVSLS